MQVSVTCLGTEEGDILLDPVTSEEALASTVSTYDFTFNSSSLTEQPDASLLSSACSGSFSPADMKTALEVCNAASVNIDTAIKGYIAKSMQF